MYILRGCQDVCGGLSRVRERPDVSHVFAERIFFVFRCLLQTRVGLRVRGAGFHAARSGTARREKARGAPATFTVFFRLLERAVAATGRARSRSAGAGLPGRPGVGRAQWGPGRRGGTIAKTRRRSKKTRLYICNECCGSSSTSMKWY